MDKSLAKLAVDGVDSGKEVIAVGADPITPYASEDEDAITPATNPGRAVMAFVKRLMHQPPSEINRAIDDESLTTYQRMGAQWLQRCLSEEKTSAGHYVASAEFQSLLDRTLGKAHYNMNVSMESKSLHLIAMNEQSIAALDSFGQ